MAAAGVRRVFSARHDPSGLVPPAFQRRRLRDRQRDRDQPSGAGGCGGARGLQALWVSLPALAPAALLCLFFPGALEVLLTRRLCRVGSAFGNLLPFAVMPDPSQMQLRSPGKEKQQSEQGLTMPSKVRSSSHIPWQSPVLPELPEQELPFTNWKLYQHRGKYQRLCLSLVFAFQ
ncbi:uncharacterized protein LOC121339598 isoform X1 [Onychostruthus taczanowskii]|uniref:uncharacterized protein LOC121339598 isoform X1 n=1 Tax=Onychostruthus taczanowskii TaxID=356909 RepID=UPI001B8042E7|nr:uncharacterized protein LOC121339598 isoform X1 [Onychostruthus taczanowskii]